MSVQFMQTEHLKDQTLILFVLTIGAGAGGAVVNLLLTVEPCIPRGALAEVASVRVVSTAASIGARPISTRHGA